MKGAANIGAIIAATALLAVGASAGNKPETRCGILSNPTPANWWLTDRHGEWTIGVQGGYQAEGLETVPESFFEDGWERTNGYYGYRCACLKVTTDAANMRIGRIHSGAARPMKACTSDKALQKTLNRPNP